jgi:hypothetical protein
VDSICLDARGKGGLLLNAMHDINKSIENSHVKINIVYTLHRVKQEIAEASDDATRKYYEEIPKAKRIGLGVTAVMRVATKTKQ